MGQKKELLHQYFGKLAAKQRQVLFLQLERKVREHGPDEQSLECLAVLREIARQNNETFDRQVSPQRIFFEIGHAFYTDSTTENKQAGRISRKHISSIWIWIKRHVAREKIEALEEKYADAMTPEEAKACRKETEELYHEFLVAVDEFSEAYKTNPNSVYRQVMQIGGDNAVEDLFELAALIRNATKVRRLNKSLNSKSISALTPEIKKNIAFVTHNCPELSDLYCAALVAKLQSPSVLLSHIIKQEKTDQAEDLVRSKSGHVLSIMLDDAEIIAEEYPQLTDDINSLDKQLYLLSRYNDIIRSLTTQLYITQKSSLFTRLTQIRVAMSKNCETRIEKIQHGLISVMNLSFEVVSIDRGHEILTEAQYRLALLTVMRNTRESIALNTLITKLWGQIEPTVEKINERATKALRNTSEELLAANRLYMDNAIKISALRFGNDYADQMRKSRESILEKRKQLMAGLA